ncbi:sulfate/molybdate ABC transporter ATP-binding protein [Thiorhodococcus fuscus]|uniref:Sulfate/molybdate ABC transporter ATP-binding protein n=1 Tax=Thiorhodococcus fuscus TaxID=527200 RepID=A0ABW4Y7B3_9GAMM
MSIRVEHIHKRFGDFAALNDVSLDFPSGALTALLGPSGCGKTTLLRIIAGLESADSGRVILDDEDASGTHVRQRRVGFVFQHYALFRHMTVFENIAFGLRVKPRRERPREADIRRRVQRLLDLVQLGSLAERFPPQLSGGQRQRVALARALAVEPCVLLLDEPFGALDAQVRKDLRRWLRRLHDELHITSVFVTHDQEEALEVADRVVLMNQGRVEQWGTPDAVYEHPSTPFVYGFLGAVNRFQGHIDGAHLRIGEARLAHHQNAAAHGSQAVGFVRPHELEILTDPMADQGIEALVARVLTFGANARIELEDPIGDADTGEPRHYEVILPRERIAELGLTAGQTVRLAPSRIQVFAERAA